MKFDASVNHIKPEVGNAEEILKLMSQTLCRQGYVKESHAQAVVDREKKFPTGLMFEKCGVALPHADCCHVSKPMIAVSILKEPIVFKSMADAVEDIPCKMVIMLAMNKSENQLQLLSTLMETLQNNDFMDALLAAQTTEKITDLMSDSIKI